MPRIPLRQVEERATTELPRIPVDPNAFGAGIGKAQQGLGDSVASVGSQLNALATEGQDTLRRQNVAANIAGSDYTQRDLQRKQAAPADGKDFYKETGSDYDAWVEERTANITDPKERQETKAGLMARKNGYLAQGAQFEVTQQVGNSKLKADEALNAVENRVRADPSQFDQALKDSHALIDSRAEIPASQREAMKIGQTQVLSKRMFESQIANAKTPDEMDAVIKTMETGDTWKSRMSGADYDRMLDSAKASKGALNTKVDTEARSALESVKDRNNNRQVIDPSEMAGVEASVKASKNPGLQWQLTELREQQAIYRQFQGLTPEQYREKIAAQRGQQVSAGLPTEISGAINNAAGKTGIAATYLAGMFNKEYGTGKFNREGGAGGNEAGTSSAVGIAQFVKGTAVQIAKGGDGFNARLMGIDIAGKSDDEIHAMFKDPQVAMVGAALLARQNGNAIQRAIGRPPSDGELYMAHFLGAGGAVAMLKGVQSDPNQSAAALLPDAAKANRSVFYSGDRALTVAEVTGRVTSLFMGGPSRVSELRATTLEGMAGAQQKALKDDMVSYGSQSGRFVVNTLDSPNSFVERGKTATAMADYFSIPRQDAQPFTKGEAESLTQTVKNGSTDDVLNVLAQVQALGGDMARAGAKQLGQTDSVFGFAAGLAADRGARDVAGDIVRGQKRIDADKDIKQAIGDDKVVTQQFNSLMGKALNGMDPAAAQAAKDAALAHYVETYVSRSAGKFGAFDKNAYAASVNAVMGGGKGAAAVDAVNGEQTVVPPGVSGKEFDRALDSFTIDDYTASSKDGKPPRYADGTIAKPEDIAVEGKFRYIGGNEYRIEMGDGKFLLSDISRDRTATAYRFVADPSKIKNAATAPAKNQAGPAIPADASPIMQPGGALPNFDPVTGRWMGPTK